MNLNDLFSNPSHVKEAYTNNYPSSTPADATAAATLDNTNDDPDIMRNWDRFGKNLKPDQEITPLDSEEEEAVRNHIDRWQTKTKNLPDPFAGPTTYKRADGSEFVGSNNSDSNDADPTFMVEPNKYMQSWGGKYATGGAGGNSPSSIAPYGWRYVEKGEDPARYGSGTISGSGTPDWRSIAANASPSSKSASASGLPKMRFDIASQRLVPVDQPVALDLSPNVKNGSNPNIDADTRARALAWAARKNAPGGLRAQDVGPDNSVPAVVKPVAAAPAVVKPAAKPAEVPAAVTLKDLPAEKPMSWKDIAQTNGIDHPNRIMPGQVLKIPGKADYTVQPGDTLADIAAGKTKAPKYTPSPGQDPDYVAALEKLKKHPNIGVDAPIPRDMQKALGMGPITTKTYDPFGKEIVQKVGREEILTPSIIKKQDYNPTPAEAMAALRANEKAMAAKIAARDAEREANRKKVKEDDIDDQTQVSSIERDSTSDIDGKADQHFSSTSFQHDPANPNNNSYLDRQDHNGVASTTYARNVTPEWMKNLKANAGLPGAKPAAQPPSQYPTQAGQGMNNKPFAAYSTPPGQMEINRESLDRMQSLAGIRKK